MRYTVNDICNILKVQSQSKIRILLCLPEFESKRVIDKDVHQYTYNFTLDDFKRLYNLYEKRRKKLYLKGCALTNRENEIYLLLVDKGNSVNEISKKLKLKTTTIRKELDTICLKHGVSGNQRLVKLAVKYWRKKCEALQ